MATVQNGSCCVTHHRTTLRARVSRILRPGPRPYVIGSLPPCQTCGTDWIRNPFADCVPLCPKCRDFPPLPAAA